MTILDPDMMYALEKWKSHVGIIGMDQRYSIPYDVDVRFVMAAELLVRDRNVAVAQYEYVNFARAIADFGLTSQAISIVTAVYARMQRIQTRKRAYIHKGVPPYWLSIFRLKMGHSALALRSAMLSLVEDAVDDEGFINWETRGTPKLLQYTFGIPIPQIDEFCAGSFKAFCELKASDRWAERILQDVQGSVGPWTSTVPSPAECHVFQINQDYASRLIERLGKDSGKNLELLASYMFDCVPGARTKIGVTTGTGSDYDVLVSFDGHYLDFRSEIGRYVIVECKDWEKPVGFTYIAKFGRILDAARCKCGVVFARDGITGEFSNHRRRAGALRAAKREVVKMQQQHGISIIVLNLSHLKRIANGENFIAILRDEYENIRLDIEYGTETK